MRACFLYYLLTDNKEKLAIRSVYEVKVYKEKVNFSVKVFKAEWIATAQVSYN